MNLSIYKVEYLPLAEHDMAEIAAYINDELQSAHSADEFFEKVVEKFQSLSRLPYVNPVYLPIRALKNEYRTLRYKSYIAYYYVNEKAKTVTIARVLHKRRNIIDIIE